MEAIPVEIRLGQHLIKSGAVTQAQLDEALEIQKDLGGKLGRILLKLGYLNEDELLKHLARQLEVEVVKLSRVKIPPALWRMISENTIRNKKVVPISLSGGTLTVAMANPQDLEVVEEIKFETDENVVAMLAGEREIDEAIAQFFGPAADIEVPDDAVIELPKSSAAERREATSPPSPEAVKQAVAAAAEDEARETLLRYPTRLKIDALIIALLDAGVINEEALTRLVRGRAKKE